MCMLAFIRRIFDQVTFSFALLLAAQKVVASCLLARTLLDKAAQLLARCAGRSFTRISTGESSSLGNRCFFLFGFGHRRPHRRDLLFEVAFRKRRKLWFERCISTVVAELLLSSGLTARDDATRYRPQSPLRRVPYCLIALVHSCSCTYLLLRTRCIILALFAGFYCQDGFRGCWWRRRPPTHPVVEREPHDVGDFSR